ncbi:MAG: MarR family transcriptional regulator [Thermoleophilia bacterium]|nr:MarR family transcriptional regulator [Thermoleophilia bacterium]
MDGSGPHPTFDKLHRLISQYMQFSGSWRAELQMTVNEQLVVLELLDRPLTSAQLCRRIGIRSASMTNLVSGLGRKCLLERVRDPRDGRKILLYASKRAVVEVARATQSIAVQIEHLSVIDRRSVNQFLDGTLAALSEHTGTSRPAD